MKTKNAWFLAAISMSLFIGAVFTAGIATVGLYFTFALVVLGGFTMLISAIIRERNSQSTSLEPSDNDKSEEIFA